MIDPALRFTAGRAETAQTAYARYSFGTGRGGRTSLRPALLFYFLAGGTRFARGGRGVRSYTSVLDAQFWVGYSSVGLSSLTALRGWYDFCARAHGLRGGLRSCAPSELLGFLLAAASD